LYLKAEKGTQTITMEGEHVERLGCLHDLKMLDDNNQFLYAK